MTRHFVLRMLAILMAATLLLAACRRTQTPAPTNTPIPTPTVTATVAEPGITGLPQVPGGTTTVEPLETPLAPIPSLSPSPAAPGVYPPPGQATPTATTSSGIPYPGPGTPLPTSTTSSGTPYPLAGTAGPTVPSIPASPTPTAQSRQQTPYPGIASATPAAPTASPYPGPGGVTATPAPTGGPSPTPAATSTPALTSTPFQVRARIDATDPETFKVISGQPQLVEFFAYWSPESRSMAPVVNALEDRYESRIRFVYLDIDDPRNSLYKSLIDKRLPPLFYLLDAQGAVLNEWQGIVAPEEFEGAFAAIGQ